MTVIVAGEIKINPAGRDGALDLLGPFVAATRAEQGCIAYGFYEDLTQPGTIRLYEEWADEAALDAHMATPHMAQFNARIGEIEVLSVSVKFFKAEEFQRG